MKSERNDIEKNVVATNFLWRFLERFGAQGVSLIVSIILARLLEPETYGIIALVTIFTSIMNVFIDSGMGNALIQKKDADDLDFSTVFYFNIVVCLGLYTLMFVAAPLIAQFYNMPELTLIVRVLSLTLLISGTKNVQQAYISRNMMFKKFFFATLSGTIIAAIVGIVMAYKGYGVWALVAQQLVNVTIGTIILWFTVKWRPKLVFSIQRLQGLFSYGWKLLVSNIINTVYGNIQQLLIGKMYSYNALAYYNQGKSYPEVIVNNVNVAIDSVLLPTMSKVQDDRSAVKAMTRRSIMVSTYILAPVMVGIAATSRQFVSVLLTDKWLPSVPFLVIFCITFIFYPIHTANLNAIKAMGRSDLYLKLEVAKKSIGIILLLSTMRFGVMAMALSLLVNSVFSQIINAWPNKKLLSYSYGEQLRDISPSLLLSLTMGIVVWSIGYLVNVPNIIVLLIQLVVGVLVYFVGSILTKNEAYIYGLSIIKGLLKRSNEKCLM